MEWEQEVSSPHDAKSLVDEREEESSFSWSVNFWWGNRILKSE
jgi:hypothetical protein